MSLRRISVAAMVLCSPIVLAGCGSANRTLNLFPFTGNYAGPFSFTGDVSSFPNQVGTLSVAITSAGVLNGSADDVTLGQTATATGTVDKSGNLNAVLTLPSVSANLSGPVEIAENGHLVGNLTETVGTTVVGHLAVDLTKQ